jgi:hypothetical protein
MELKLLLQFGLLKVEEGQGRVYGVIESGAAIQSNLMSVATGLTGNAWETLHLNLASSEALLPGDFNFLQSG